MPNNFKLRIAGAPEPVKPDLGLDLALDEFESTPPSYEDTVVDVGNIIMNLRELVPPRGMESEHEAAIKAADALSDYLLALWRTAEPF